MPLRTQVASALLVFDDLFAASAALPALVATGAATLELMDATSLRVGQSFPDCPPAIARIAVAQQAALLLEYQSTAAEELAEITAAARPTLADLPTAEPVELTSDAGVRGGWWKLRKGLYSSVAGARPTGTTALLEDVVVPVPALAQTCRELAVLFDRYAYADCVVFGHAKDGNIHFMLTDRFETDEQLGRYAEFTEDMVEVVLGHDGSLKAEHGTGRVMAPYVRRQYGDELYEVMCGIKRLFDPHGILNPGVVISDDPQLHLKDIKLAPVVEPEVDRCTACGFCEPVCPSRDITLTPRQRIAALAGDPRGRAGRRHRAGRAPARRLRLRGRADLRGRRHVPDRLPGADQHRGPGEAAAHGRATPAGRRGLDAGREELGCGHPGRLGRADRDVAPAGRARPGRRRGQPGGPRGGRRPTRCRSGRASCPAAARGGGGPRPAGEPTAVYLPACVNTMFGPADGGPGVQVSFEQLCARAGIDAAGAAGDRVVVLRDAVVVQGHPGRLRRDARAGAAGGARGDPRRGAPGGHRRLLVHRGLPRAARPGDAPQVRVLDAMQFVAERVLPALGEYQRVPSVSVHPTCSSTRLQLNATLGTLAAAVAEDVHVPRGLGLLRVRRRPGDAAPGADRVGHRAGGGRGGRARAAAAHVSCNRTCELGMTRATGAPYRHVLELLAEVAASGP